MTLYQKLMHATNSANGNVLAFMLDEYDFDEPEPQMAVCEYCSKKKPVTELESDGVCNACIKFWE